MMCYLADELLGHDLEELVLLQGLAGHVDGQVVAVHQAAHKVQVSRQ